MKALIGTASLAVVCALSLHGAIVLIVDVSNPNAVTFTSTTSFATSGTVFAPSDSSDGVDLLGFFKSDVGVLPSGTFLSSSLTPSGTSGAFNNWSPDNQSGSTRDLNLWNSVGGAGSMQFDSSVRAFTGQASINMALLGYTSFLPSAGASGNILNGYSAINDGNTIGQWSVVPEPQTYAMLAGLGLVGFATVRRMVKK